MTKVLYIPAFLIFLAISSQKANCQERKEITDTKVQRNFYQKSLKIDSAIALQVMRAQEEYKKAMGLVAADTALTEQGRRTKIERLINEKNRRLRALLSPLQQQKIIPSTERISMGESLQR